MRIASLFILSSLVWCHVSLAGVQDCRATLLVHYYTPQNSSGFLKWDCPVFAAYDDGSIVWRKEWECALTALAFTTEPSAQSLVRRTAAIVGRHSGKNFVLTGSSDPDITTLSYGDTTVTILGDWLKPRTIDKHDLIDSSDLAKVNQNENNLWSTLPNELRLILSELKSFDPSRSIAWRPSRLNIRLQPPIRTDLKAINWPSNWPHSFSPVGGSSHMKTIDLPGDMLDEILALIPNDREPKIIGIGGEARYGELRLLFPGEKPAKNGTP